jgi:hypothetical protein
MRLSKGQLFNYFIFSVLLIVLWVVPDATVIDMKDSLIVTGLILTTWRYLDAKERELVWKRTETLFSLLDRFEQDEKISRAAVILAGRDNTINVDQLYSKHQDATNEIERKALDDMDHLLGYLERLVYANSNGSLTNKELDMCGWYFRTIIASPPLVRYCQHNGYKDLIAFSSTRK